MKTFFFVALAIFQVNSYASLCTDMMDEKILTIANCRHKHKNECSDLQSEYESLSTLSKARHLLKLAEVMDDTEADHLRGDELVSFLNKHHDSTKGKLLSFDMKHFYGGGLPLPVTYSKSYYKNIVQFFDTSHEDYFLRYVRILNREIPWEEINKLEKGLTFGEIKSSLKELNSSKCPMLMKRYGLRISWKDVAREALDNHFKNILKKSR